MDLADDLVAPRAVVRHVRFLGGLQVNAGHVGTRPRLLALVWAHGEMQTLIEDVWREQGFTAVLVTHDVTEAIVLGDRVVLIEDGIIKLELEIDLPRPRRRGSPEVAALEEKILRHLLSDGEFRDIRDRQSA